MTPARWLASGGAVGTRWARAMAGEIDARRAHGRGFRILGGTLHLVLHLVFGTAMLAVYDAAEAAELVTAGITAPILVLMPVRTLQRTDALYRHAARERLHLAVHAPDQLDELNELGHSFGLRLPVHLYLDTGMSRAGLSESQFGEALVWAQALEGVRVTGVYSHLATADGDGAFAAVQRARFEQALALHEAFLPSGARRHLANTCGTLRDPGLHFDMVRPGLGLIGFGPEQMPAGEAHARLDQAHARLSPASPAPRIAIPSAGSPESMAAGSAITQSGRPATAARTSAWRRRPRPCRSRPC